MHVHRHRVGAETDVLAQVEIVDRFDKADASDLKKVVNIFSPVIETLDHT